MKSYIKLLVLFCCLFSGFAYNCYSGDLEILDHFTNDLASHKESFREYLDTNNLVDATEFLAVLDKDTVSVRNFKMFLDTLDYYNRSRAYLVRWKSSMEYCNLLNYVHSLTYHFLNTDNPISGIHFLNLGSPNRKKFKLHIISSFDIRISFLNNYFEKEIALLNHEMEILINKNFDFESYESSKHFFDVTEFKAFIKKNSYTELLYNDFLDILKNEKCTIETNYWGFPYGDQIIFFPSFCTSVFSDNHLYSIIIERRNCTCTGDPDYHVTRITKSY